MGGKDTNRLFKFLPRSPIKHIKLTLWVILHWCVVVGNFSAFFILAYRGLHPEQYTPWYIALPLCTMISLITFSRVLDCPATRVENRMRKAIGLPEIRGFIRHYFLKPYVRRKRQRQKKREEKNK